MGTANNTSEEGTTQPLPSAVEFEPPLACVRRILKNTLPASTHVGKDASSAFARACGIFIIYLSACANDFARENRRQTITANDVLAAVKELAFDEFTPQLTEFLDVYRAGEKSKKDAKAKAAAARAEAEADEESRNSLSPTTKENVEEEIVTTPKHNDDDESTEDEHSDDGSSDRKRKRESMDGDEDDDDE